MSAVIRQDWRPKTIKELFIQWQAYRMETWDHTAAIRSSLATGKSTPAHFHPLLKKASNLSSVKIPKGPIFPTPSTEPESVPDHLL